jgi:hypothetical protein
MSTIDVLPATVFKPDGDPGVDKSSSTEGEWNFASEVILSKECADLANTGFFCSRLRTNVDAGKIRGADQIVEQKRSRGFAQGQKPRHTNLPLKASSVEKHALDLPP